MDDIFSVDDCAEYVREKLPQTAVLMQFAEECAEAAQAALKLARVYQGINPTPVTAGQASDLLTEEIADVFVCIRCLDGVDYDAINEIEEMKLRRWASRLARLSAR